MLHSLFAFSVLLIVISFFPVALKIIKIETPAVPYHITLYFEYIQKEIAQAKQLYTSGNTLYVSFNDGTLIKYEKYGTNIRRQVNGAGNEILLQKVERIQYQLVENGVYVSVEAAEGKLQKRLSMAPKIY